MSTQEGTTIGKTLTLLLIFVVTIVAIVVIFAYFGGLFGFIKAGGGSMAATGFLSQSGSGGFTGELVMQVEDTGHSSITALAFTCPTAQFTSADCGGLLVYDNGVQVSSQSPLKPGQTASGSTTVIAAQGSPFTAGRIYTVQATATFSDGSTLSQTLSLPAQS